MTVIDNLAPFVVPNLPKNPYFTLPNPLSSYSAASD